MLDYIAALEGGPAWDEIEDREQIDLVWIKPDRPLARRLADDPCWRLVYEDHLSILFARVPQKARPAVLTVSGE